MVARLIICIAALTLGGCLAIPHMDQRSPFISGKIVDARTCAPLKDAKVVFTENPSFAVLTDDAGKFTIRATSKPELFIPLGPALGTLQIGSKIPPLLRVSGDGYETIEVDGSKIENLDESQYEKVPRTNLRFEGPFHLKAISIRPVTPD